MTNHIRAFLGVAALCFTILFVAGAASADSRTKVPAPPPPPPPPRNVESPASRSDLGQKLQFQLNEANSIYNRSMSSGTPGKPAGDFGRVPAMRTR